MKSGVHDGGKRRKEGRFRLGVVGRIADNEGGGRTMTTNRKPGVGRDTSRAGEDGEGDERAHGDSPLLQFPPPLHLLPLLREGEEEEECEYVGKEG